MRTAICPPFHRSIYTLYIHLACNPPTLRTALTCTRYLFNFILPRVELELRSSIYNTNDSNPPPLLFFRTFFPCGSNRSQRGKRWVCTKVCVADLGAVLPRHGRARYRWDRPHPRVCSSIGCLGEQSDKVRIAHFSDAIIVVWGCGTIATGAANPGWGARTYGKWLATKKFS